MFVSHDTALKYWLYLDDFGVSLYETIHYVFFMHVSYISKLVFINRPFNAQIFVYMMLFSDPIFQTDNIY